MLRMCAGGERGGGRDQLAAGDRVRVECGRERWEELQKDHGDWDNLVAEVRTARVTSCVLTAVWSTLVHRHYRTDSAHHRQW